MNHNTHVTQFDDVTKESDQIEDVNQNQYEDDQRLKPKPRKHAALWQLYLVQQELVEFRKRHLLRESSANKGVSNLEAEFERTIINMFYLDQHVEPKTKAQREGGVDRKGNEYPTPSLFYLMAKEGAMVGPIWDWLLSHKGIGESLAAKILALIDDIERFDTIAKLWRYSGYGLNHYWCDKTGKAICPKEGWKWIEVKPKVKYRVWTVVDSHYKNVTQNHHVNLNGSNDHLYYVTQVMNVNSKTKNDHSLDATQSYDVPIEKQWAIPQNKDLEPLKRVDFLEPEPEWELKNLSDRLCKKYHAPYCTPLKSTLFLVAESFMKCSTPPYKDLYNVEKERLMNERGIKKGHAHNMALRKMKKEFLKQLWLTWRGFEGLPIGDEY